MLQSEMPLNNHVKSLEIRFFGLIFANIFMTLILGELTPPFQWLKATLSIGSGFELANKNDSSHHSRSFTGVDRLLESFSSHGLHPL